MQTDVVEVSHVIEEQVIIHDLHNFPNAFATIGILCEIVLQVITWAEEPSFLLR
ncbi:hypothetical protein DPEC_G00037850, partial [Dallia pectoralis]